MRALFLLIVLGAAGYLGYNFYMERQGGGTAAGDEVPQQEAIHAPSGSGAPTAATAPPPKPFVSRIKAPPPAAPGEKRLAPPGTFYMVDRVVVETPHGIVAVVPGDKVLLLQRKPTKLKLTTGKFDFEVAPEKVTNDIDLALAAEQKAAQIH